MELLVIRFAFFFYGYKRARLNSSAMMVTNYFSTFYYTFQGSNAFFKSCLRLSCFLEFSIFRNITERPRIFKGVGNLLSFYGAQLFQFANELIIFLFA